MRFAISILPSKAYKLLVGASMKHLPAHISSSGRKVWPPDGMTQSRFFETFLTLGAVSPSSELVLTKQEALMLDEASRTMSAGKN